jgi:hypothetical protein
LRFRNLTLAFSCVAAVFASNTAAQTQPISIQFEAGAYQVSGWTPPHAAPPKGWASVFAVYAGSGDIPAMLGSYAVENGRLVFHPAFAQSPGVRYRAVFRPPAGSPIEKIFDGPAKETARTTRVERVYPSGAILPSNQLRLYIYFSAPMSQGEAGERVRLLDGAGKSLPGVFLPGEELWDPQFRRLTVTFDPGRIKRGLTSNQSMGPPIVEGKQYSLVIDRDWLDARGVPMIEGFRKTFRGGPAQRNPPDPKQWRLTAPAAASVGPLTVIFPTPMNYVLLQRMLWVAGPEGKVDGAIAVDSNESRWLFTPRTAWKAGQYNLTAGTGIEDLAGNHIGQPFDIDVFERVTRQIVASTITLPFSVR